MILIFLLYQEVNKGNAIIRAFTSANWVNVILGLLLLVPNIFLQFLKWRFVLRSRYPESGNRLAAKSLLFGFTLGFVTPGNLGELARGLYFKNFDRVVVTGLTIIDKLFGQIIFVSLGFISINIILFSSFKLPGFVVTPVLVLSSLFLIIIWLTALNPHWIRSFLYAVNSRLPLQNKIRNLISSLDHFNRNHSSRLLFLNLFWFLVIFFQYHILVLAFTDISFFDSLLAVSAVLFTKVALPVSIADLGIREGAAVFFYSLYQIPEAATFNAALLIFVINFLIPSILGSYFVFKLRWEVRNYNTAEIMDEPVEPLIRQQQEFQ